MLSISEVRRDDSLLKATAWSRRLRRPQAASAPAAMSSRLAGETVNVSAWAIRHGLTISCGTTRNSALAARRWSPGLLSSVAVKMKTVFGGSLGSEQGVEGGGEHDFVDDEHLVTGVDGLILDHLPDGLHVLDRAVGSAVDLQNVHRPILVDSQAKLAGVAGCGRRSVGAVESLGQDAGGRRLARTPRAGKEIGLGDLSHPDGVLEGLGDGLLADHVLERPGPVFAGQHQVRHRFGYASGGDRSAPAAKVNNILA
jgi:hypothetical protein